MEKSKKLFTAAQVHIPGGVNSPVRAFKAVGGSPVFLRKREELIFLTPIKNAM